MQRGGGEEHYDQLTQGEEHDDQLTHSSLSLHLFLPPVNTVTMHPEHAHVLDLFENGALEVLVLKACVVRRFGTDYRCVDV